MRFSKYDTFLDVVLDTCASRRLILAGILLTSSSSRHHQTATSPSRIVGIFFGHWRTRFMGSTTIPRYSSAPTLLDCAALFPLPEARFQLVHTFQLSVASGGVSSCVQLQQKSPLKKVGDEAHDMHNLMAVSYEIKPSWGPLLR